MSIVELEELLENLNGSYEIIFFKEGIPIVFLLDENHDNPSDSIQLNIENAKTLINKANVNLIGVESLAGGLDWDKENRVYLNGSLDDKWYIFHRDKYRNNNTTFIDGLADHTNLIVGVESIGMIEKIEEEYVDNIITDISANPLNRVRSRHFLRTLFDEFRSNKSQGNIILNCGLSHNNDIVEFINQNEILELINVEATFVRINTISD